MLNFRIDLSRVTLAFPMRALHFRLRTLLQDLCLKSALAWLGLGRGGVGGGLAATMSFQNTGIYSVVAPLYNMLHQDI